MLEKSDKLRKVQLPEDLNMAYAERSLAIACTRGREAIVIRFKELLHAEKLTEQQWRILRILIDQGPMIGSDLTKLSCIHKASMTRIMSSLEKMGYVQRTPSGDDRRASTVSLSESGTELMERLMPVANEIYKGIVNDIGLVKYRRLLSLLQDLAEINEPW